MVPGSDDARAPNFPVDVLGSRSDAPMDVMTPKNKTGHAFVSTVTNLSNISVCSCCYFAILPYFYRPDIFSSDFYFAYILSLFSVISIHFYFYFAFLSRILQVLCCFWRNLLKASSVFCAFINSFPLFS